MGGQFDLTLADSVGTVGYMVTRDKKGNLLYNEKSMGALNFLQASGYVDESSQNPEMMYPLAWQKSWVGGFGQYFMGNGENRRYYASYGVDASIDGQLQLGPAWTAVNWPTVATYSLLDGGLEVWASASDLTNYIEETSGAGSTVSRQSATPHGGTYCARMAATLAVGSYARIKQSVTWNNDFRSKKFQLNAYCRINTTNGTPIYQIRLYDGISYTSTTATSVAPTWAKYTVTKTLASNATELTVIIEATGGVADSGYIEADDLTLTGYTVNSSFNAYAEYNNLQYLSLGDILYAANSASAPTSWTYVGNFVDNITALFPSVVSGTAYLFIMLGSGNTAFDNGWYYDGTILDQMTDAGGTKASGDFMTIASTTFYIAGRPAGVTTGTKYAIRTNTAPLAGAWSGDTKVGDPNTNITGLITVNGVVYVAKEDSLWKVNTDGTVSMVVDYRMLYKSTSGAHLIGWNNNVYVPCGTASLIEYVPGDGTYSDISPASSITSTTQAKIAVASAVLSASQSDFTGRIMAVSGGNDYLWVTQLNGSVVNLFKGKYANIDGVGWHWHPVGNTTMGTVNAMAVSSLTGAPIVWVAHGTGNPGYYDLAKYATTDPTYTVPMMITPFYTGGVWRMIKELYSIILGLESITANVYITLQYRFYGTTTWSTALTFDGNPPGTVTSGQDQNYMPANSYGTAIQFRLNFISNSATATPKVTRISGEGKIKPSEVPVYEFTTTLADNQVGKNGVRDGVLASRKKTALDNVRSAYWPVTFTDIGGNSVSVDVLSRELVDWHKEYRRNPKMVYHVLAHKVTLS